MRNIAACHYKWYYKTVMCDTLEESLLMLGASLLLLVFIVLALKNKKD